MNTLAFAMYFLNLLVQFADAYLTEDGLTHKLVEGWGPTKFLFTKIGVTGVNAIKIGALPFLLILVPAIAGNIGYAALLNGLMAGVTLPVVVKNLKLLKKNKISL
jgi:hypothetical protein